MNHDTQQHDDGSRESQVSKYENPISLSTNIDLNMDGLAAAAEQIKTELKDLGTFEYYSDDEGEHLPPPLKGQVR